MPSPQLYRAIFRWLFSAFFTIAAADSTSARSDGFEIGSLGARVELSEQWKRRKINANLGEDQFLCIETRARNRGDQIFAVVTEVIDSVESEADYRRILELAMTVGHERPIELTRDERWTRVTRKASAKIKDLDFAFRADVLVQDGLSYAVLTWTMQSLEAWLDRMAGEFLAGFRFPGADSAWKRGLEPTRRVVEVDGYRLSFAVRPFVLRESEPVSGVLLRLEDDNAQHGLAVFEGSGSRADQALNETAKFLRNHDASFAVASRADQIVSEVRCRRLVGFTSSLTYHVLVLPLTTGRHLEVRHWSPGGMDQPRKDRDLLFSSLELAATSSALDLPPATSAPAPVRPRVQQFLDRTRLLAVLEDQYVTQAIALSGDRWLLVEWQFVRILGADGTCETLLEVDGSAPQLAQWNEAWLAADAEGAVREVEQGLLSDPIVFRAHALCVAGEALLLSRPSVERELVGMPNELVPHDVLVRREKDGRETAIASLPLSRVQRIQGDAGGTAVLVSAYGRESSLGAVDTKLQRVEIETGAITNAGRWKQIDALGPAESGWLVTGQPEGERLGIWHVQGPQRRVLLVSDRQALGIELKQDRLVFGRRSGSDFEVRTASLDDCRAFGALCQPFGLGDLESLGRRMMQRDAAPRTEAEIRAAVGELEPHAIESCGTALPTQPEDVDELLEAAAYESELGIPGRALLSMLFAVALLDRGAKWVDAQTAEWTHWIAPGPNLRDSAFAIALIPSRAVSWALDDSEAMSSQCDEQLVHSRGRQVLLGLEANELTSRLAQLEPPSFPEALAKLDPEGLRKILDEHRDNVALRSRLYACLAARGATSAIEAFAVPFAARSCTDREAHLSAWNARVQSAEDARSLLEAANAAVREHPASAALAFVLGQAYEKLGNEQRERARAAYARALQLQRWGSIGAAAADAMRRLKD